ncbi:MAG: hypothetical protein WCY37_03860 [Candidatus Dojkabacteria bacterium]
MTKAAEAIKRLNEIEAVLENESFLTISSINSYKLVKHFEFIRAVLKGQDE